MVRDPYYTTEINEYAYFIRYFQVFHQQRYYIIVFSTWQYVFYVHLRRRCLI